MKLIFSSHAWDDYLHWQKTDRKMVKRINLLITDVLRDPVSGIGKPEALRHGLAGYWSRRINDQHRLVYKADGDAIYIAQLRFRY